MPNMISLGVLNVSTPQQNAGVFIGQINMTGWDSHQKVNLGHGALFGFWDCSSGQFIHVFDGGEWMDGVMFDQDIKSQIASNF